MNSIIRLQNISFNRGKYRILNNISWEINHGEHWALIGPNGCGKTTLLKIISGYLWPSSGKVHVLGEEFGKTDLRELRKHIGWVSSYLIEKLPPHDSVLNMVISGKDASFGVYSEITEQDIKKAKDLLEFLGATSLLEKPLEILSQGERQKILLARGLMADPKILLLDEPCTGLDPKARETFLQSVSKICKEKKSTVVFITHHYEEIVDEIEQVIMLKNGDVFEKGQRKEKLTKQKLDQLFQ